MTQSDWPDPEDDEDRRKYVFNVGTTNTYTLRGLPCGTKHFFKIQAESTADTKGWGALSGAVHASTSTCLVPTGLVADAKTPSELDLTWSGHSNATKYQVQKDYGAGWKDIGSSAGTVMRVSHLVDTVVYKFRVRAMYGEGAVSAWSNELKHKFVGHYDTTLCRNMGLHTMATGSVQIGDTVAQANIRVYGRAYPIYTLGWIRGQLVEYKGGTKYCLQAVVTSTASPSATEISLTSVDAVQFGSLGSVKSCRDCAGVKWENGYRWAEMINTADLTRGKKPFVSIKSKQTFKVGNQSCNVSLHHYRLTGDGTPDGGEEIPGNPDIHTYETSGSTNCSTLSVSLVPTSTPTPAVAATPVPTPPTPVPAAAPVPTPTPEWKSKKAEEYDLDGDGVINTAEWLRVIADYENGLLSNLELWRARSMYRPG